MVLVVVLVVDMLMLPGIVVVGLIMVFHVVLHGISCCGLVSRNSCGGCQCMSNCGVIYYSVV